MCAPLGIQGQVHSLERMAEEDVVGFGLATCENLLSGRHLRLQYECLLLQEGIRQEEGERLGMWPSDSQEQGGGGVP